MCEATVDFRKGDRFPELVFLGACPGRDEFQAVPQRPFAGQSGLNLRSLLDVLRDLPDKEAYGFQRGDFVSDRVDDYTLMNSHAEAKWRAQHGRTTPQMREVVCPVNIRRISDQLRTVNARIVIGLGRPIANDDLTRTGKDSGPMRAIRKLVEQHEGVLFLVTGHPSARAVNRYGDGNARQWFRTKLCRFPL